MLSIRTESVLLEQAPVNNKSIEEAADAEGKRNEVASEDVNVESTGEDAAAASTEER